MRPALLVLLVLLGLLLPAQSQRSTADDTDWQDCLSCHADYASQLPALSALRPSLNAQLPSVACSHCHDTGLPEFFAGDWTHPVRSIGEHIGCDNCHPAVPHSAEFPPPVPTGDYRNKQCFACHADMELKSHDVSRHLGGSLTDCIDCHAPHKPLRALLPEPLLSTSQRERRGSSNSPQSSNATCMTCHSSFDLFYDTREGFVTLNTENYHRRHVVDNSIGCIECHDPHGSSKSFLMRSNLLTGEIFSYTQTGQGAGCSITCHGASHNFTEYVNRLR